VAGSLATTSIPVVLGPCQLVLQSAYLFLKITNPCFCFVEVLDVVRHLGLVKLDVISSILFSCDVVVVLLHLCLQKVVAVFSAHRASLRMVQAMELVAPLPREPCPSSGILGAFSSLPFLYRAYWLVVFWMGLPPIPIPRVWGLVVHVSSRVVVFFFGVVLVVEYYHWENFFILRYTN
jgi:hypothetical protein